MPTELSKKKMLEETKLIIFAEIFANENFEFLKLEFLQKD
jgi:hypothetical protein